MFSFEKTGEYATIFLIISSLSGLVVAYHYDTADPFVSTVAMDSVIPWGKTIRSAHFYSSQFFFGMLFLHVLRYIRQSTRDDVTRSFCIKWSVTGVSFITTILTLFTGYVLRYDSTGQAAGAIAEHLLLAMPQWPGEILNHFLISIQNDGVTRVYAAHIMLTCIIWTVGVFYHTRKLIFNNRSLWLFFSAVFFFCMLIPAPMDQSETEISILKGPWFFLGVQELLLHLPAFWAGILFPAFFVLLFLFLPWLNARKRLYSLLCLWISSYLFLSLIMILR